MSDKKQGRNDGQIVPLESWKNPIVFRTARSNCQWTGIFIFVALVAFLQAVPSIYGAEPPQSSDHQDVQQLIQQLQQLQARVEDLETKLSAMAPSAAHVSLAVASSTLNSPTPSAAVTNTAATAQEPETDSFANGVKLRLFGDIGYEFSDQKGETNSFHIGSLDMFMTAPLSDRLSILGELLLIPLPGNRIETDIERLLLQYKHNDYLTASIGRYHSSIGYYNTAFHQGAWFQTAIDRPFMYAFDDHEGFLPLQDMGISLNGQIPSGKLRLNYVVEVGNGRSHLLDADPAQNFEDENNGKSVNIALFARPNWLPGLQAGVSFYRDHLTFSDNYNHDEQISTVHLVYVNSRYEFLNEAMLVRHATSANGGPGVFYTPGFYSQLSRGFGKYRPYFRYAYVNAGANDPIYADPADGPIVGRRNGPSVGIRWDFNDHAAMKLQYDHLARRGHASNNDVETQFSFAF